MESYHSRAFVNVPVVEQGHLVAVMFVNHAEQRDWSAEESDFVREVANRTRMAVERVKGETARQAAAQAEQVAVLAMHQLDKQFRALVTASSDAVYRMDPGWRRVISLEGGNFLSDTTFPDESWLEKYIPAEDRAIVSATIEQAVESRSIFQLEHRVVKADATTGWTLSRAIPVFNDAGELTEWFGAASDVTHRKLVEQELQDRDERLREADRRKDEFLATLAHELRNPLAPIRNAVHLLAKISTDERVQRLRDMLERQVGHMVRLVDDLMEISRVSRGEIELKLEKVKLAEVMEPAVESTRPLIDAAGHSLAISMPAQPQWVQGDPVRLTQVLSNLLNNAARYTPPGGEIELRAKAAADGRVQISVADNGIGIAADQLPRLFEMFSQLERRLSRANGGLGIGLALARRLVQMHGGTLSAQSDGLDRGARFTVSLPSLAAGDQMASPAMPHALPQRSGVRVLLVDDNRDAADTTAELLTVLGAEVRVAYSGAQALAAVRDWQPALVILDIGMPEMDGHEVARRIHAELGERRPVLSALTGWGQADDRARTQASGFDHHLVKPVDMLDLERLMATLPVQEDTARPTS